jgi:predicted alpha/beta superfamily hydrolase
MTTLVKDPGDDLVHFPRVETHLISSHHVAQTFKIQVALPPRRQSEVTRLPVIYLTDGNLVFNLFKEISSLLQTMGIHPFPSFILVGISYPSEAQYAGTFLRMRDFTTLDHPRVDKRSARSLFPIEGILTAEDGTKDHGGAEDFLRFIGDELIPFIDEKYQTIPGDRTYVGHSGGGFLGLLALFTQSRMFRNYVISSPGLFYDGETSGGFRYDNDDFGFPMAREFIASGQSLEGISLYMSVGSEEEFQSGYLGAQLTSSFYRMAALLKSASIPGLKMTIEVIPGETHMTVWPIALMHGVQAVFGLRRVGGLC